VVNGVVSLELIKQSHPSNQLVNINHWLIEKGYAQQADESYLSKVSVPVEYWKCIELAYRTMKYF
jgi:hypothetical protein